MKRVLTAIVAVAFIAMGGAGAVAQSKDRAREKTVTGKWTLTVSGGAHGDAVMTLALKQDGTKVTGSLTTPHGEVAFTGRFSANTLELETAASDANTPRVTFTATLKEDGTLAGYMSGERGDATVTAVRDVDAKK